MLSAFELIDNCVEHYEHAADNSVYARVCGLTLLKGKNLAQGALSLVLDALGQESGALLRPLIEYIELLTYLRKFPEQAERAAENDLPPAGKRAQAIEGIYKGLRDHLNEHASHSAYSHFSLSHLLTPELSFRRLQAFTPHVLDRNFTDFTVQLQFLLQEGLLALEHVPSVPLSELAMRGEALRLRTLSVFGLDDA
ncbi:hypothetical protein MCEZEM1_03463 [Comamonadaceae bacterium]